MSRVEKASEPSMEDILSSIRKIIAEDPTAAKGSPPSPPPVAAARAVVKPASAIKPSTPSSLDDILGMADEGSAHVAAKVPVATAVAKTEPVVAPPPAQDPRAPQAERAPIQPFFPPQSRDLATPPRAAAAKSFEPSKSDLGAFVPGRPDGGLLERINGSASGGMRTTTPASDFTPPKAAEAPMPAEKPVAPAVAVARPAAPDLALAAAAQKAAEPMPVVAAKTQTTEFRPEIKSEPPKAKAVELDVGKPEAAKPEPGEAKVAAMEPAKAEAPKPASLEAVVAAASTFVTPAQRRVVTVDTAVPGTSVAVTPKPAATAPVVAATSTPPAAEPVRTMEDTVAELLRPMLRQWLDQNMPRVVEKALRVELAASAQAKSDPSKT